MSLINCEFNYILTWSSNCVIVSTTVSSQGATFWITDTKCYVPVVTLSPQGNAKLLQQLKSGFKRTINWYKYQSKVAIQAQNPYLDYLIDSRFQGVNSFFVLSFGNNNPRTSYKRYFLPYIEIKDYNVMIDGQNIFDPPIKNDQRTYNTIHKIMTGQRDDHKTNFLLDYVYFKFHYKMIAADLSKRQALDTDPRAI